MSSVRRRARLVLGGALVAGAVLGACTDEGSSADFCARVGGVPPLAQVLAQVDTSDPAGTRRALEDTVDQFRALEAVSPGAIRSDVARLREGVELVVEAVNDNPDDLPAAREAIARQADELSGLARAGQSVVAYTDEECGITLDDLGGSGPPPGAGSTEPGG